MLGLANNITNTNFKHKSCGNLFNPPVYTANQFVKDLNSVEDSRLKGNFIARNLGSPTAYWGGLGIILLGELACFAKIRSAKKSDMTTLKLKKAFKNKMLLILSGALAGGIAFGVAVQKWQNKIIDKKSDKPQEFLERFGSDTSAKLADKHLRSSILAAQYNIINGTIEINKNYIHDPIGKKLVEKYIKHELQHARQFEMIAGLDNGLEKLNYACFYNLANNIKKNSVALAQIKNVIDEINNDTNGRFNNIKVPISGAKVDLKNYVRALDIMINNPQAKPEDVPILIDAEHYKRALAKRGVLSETEMQKAEEYYQAMLKYPVMSGLNLFNPFSGYRSNILEKEARKASRTKTGKLQA